MSAPTMGPDLEREEPSDAREARRLSRMEETWKLLSPSELEVAAKRRQALRRALGPGRARTRPVLWGMAAAFGTALVFAASGVVVWQSKSEEAAASAPAVQPSAAPHGVKSRGGRSAALQPKEGAQPKEEAQPTEEALEAPPPSPSAAAPTSSPEPTSNEPARSPVTQPTATLGWDKVATALRADDPTRARASLDELTKHGDPATRDAAALARAQLDGSQGDRARARQELARLSTEGATKEIRAQAVRSLARFEER